LLENLIPKLQIKEQCSFEGNFLVVKGKLRSYKIHMGSGKFLPFEGDSTLSTILSKAFMLANDNKIKDKTITSQIERR